MSKRISHAAATATMSESRYDDKRELFAMYDHERETRYLREAVDELRGDAREWRDGVSTAVEDLTDRLEKLTGAVEELTGKIGELVGGRGRG